MLISNRGVLRMGWAAAETSAAGACCRCPPWTGSMWTHASCAVGSPPSRERAVPAAAIAFAVEQPPEVGVNEIVVRPAA
ncbi:hypothetical protein GCM10027445_21960 [Amycolatopsis endophytica]|uniref:Uncharacterized protein n=1 Tax=Amycolatopsis endophytica TaxID=860233 RepID=A0A853BEK2_9PSEU|nr:hypothetical protein [Amycolatopsis endophytica]NYI93460.1 hypothetical protein [Amycolatopsis endophytica]